MANVNVSGRAFLDWLKKNDPFLYEVIMKRHKQKVGQKSSLGFIDLSDFNIGDILKTAVQTVKDVAPTLIQSKQQYELLKTQVKRAQTGAPPLDINAYSVIPGTQQTLQPTAVGYDAALVNQYANYKPSPNYLPWVAGGLGLAAVLFLTRRKRAA